MTRGAITTFSIANDAAKYFAILPALFMSENPKLQAFNIMQLHSPETAILVYLNIQCNNHPCIDSIIFEGCQI